MGTHHALVGQEVHGCKVLGVVGEGGFAIVLEAVHLERGDRVAIKCLKRPPTFSEESWGQFVEAFEEEGRLLERLGKVQPGIVRVHGSGRCMVDGSSRPYLAMEWLDGLSLDRVMETRMSDGSGPFPEAEALAIVEQLLLVLATAHGGLPDASGAMRIVAHRDIKPENLFLLASSEGPQLKLIDFGIAKVRGEGPDRNMPQPGASTMFQAFSPMYAAPEQFAKSFGEMGPWTDVFAVGLLLTELVTGRRALDGDDLGALFLSTTAAARPTPRLRGASVSDAIEGLCQRALVVQPVERYRDAGEMLADLRRLRGTVSVLSRRGAPLQGRPGSGAFGRQNSLIARSETPPSLRSGSPAPPGAKASSSGPGAKASSSAPGAKASSSGPSAKAASSVLPSTSDQPVSLPEGAVSSQPSSSSPRGSRMVEPPALSVTPTSRKPLLAALGAAALLLGGLCVRAALSSPPTAADPSTSPTTGLGASGATGASGSSGAAGEAAPGAGLRASSTAADPSGAALVASSLPSAASDPASSASAGSGGPRLRGMVKLAGGTFVEGSADGEPNESPALSVQVAAFSLDLTEVTVESYEVCVRAGVCATPRSYAHCNWGHPAKRLHPINCVDAMEAASFCTWAGKRLPTEEEWEFAARGGSEARVYPWGNAPPQKQACWSSDLTCEVGVLPEGRSRDGIFDLAGNVAEWTSTVYCPHNAPSCKSIRRVVHGGSFLDERPSHLRGASRIAEDPTNHAISIGFRCAAGG